MPLSPCPDAHSLHTLTSLAREVGPSHRLPREGGKSSERMDGWGEASAYLKGAKGLEGRDGHRHLGLVVIISVVIRVPLVQLCSKHLVWMGLDGEGGAHGKDLKEEGES